MRAAIRKGQSSLFYRQLSRNVRVGSLHESDMPFVGIVWPGTKDKHEQPPIGRSVQNTPIRKCYIFQQLTIRKLFNKRTCRISLQPQKLEIWAKYVKIGTIGYSLEKQAVMLVLANITHCSQRAHFPYSSQGASVWGRRNGFFVVTERLLTHRGADRRTRNCHSADPQTPL